MCNPTEAVYQCAAWDAILMLASNEVLYVTLEEHVLLRALALRLPERQVIRDSSEHVSPRALALGPPSRGVLYVTLEGHVLCRALALGLPNGEVLYVTRRSTLSSGR